jgi:hypothetical protein
MLRFLSPSASAAYSARWGPALIAVGLVVLLLATWWPAAPSVTAMAVLALGATGATLARFGRSPLLRTILPVHIVVYIGLYALFLGATLHAAKTGLGGGVDLTRAIDLAASVWPMIAALRISFAALRKATPAFLE